MVVERLDCGSDCAGAIGSKPLSRKPGGGPRIRDSGVSGTGGSPTKRSESIPAGPVRPDIAVSGSACRSGAPEPSHVLKEMGLEDKDAHCAIRISLGPDNTREDIDRTISAIDEAIHQSKDIIRFVSCR